NKEVLKRLVQSDNIKAVVLIARYLYYLNKFSEEKFRTGLSAIIEKLQKSGKKVFVIYPIPSAHFSVPHILALRAAYGKDLEYPVITKKDFLNSNEKALKMLDELVAKSGVVAIKP